MSAFIDKAWEKQRACELWFEEAWKHRLERRRARFKDVDLPDIKSVVALRNGLFAIAVLCLVPAGIQVFTGCFDWINPCEGFEFAKYCSYDRPWWAGLHIYGWFLFIGLVLFGFLVDYCVYKRKEKSLFFN